MMNNNDICKEDCASKHNGEMEAYMTVTIPLREYRDLLIANTEQKQEIANMGKTLCRFAKDKDAAQMKEDFANRNYDKLKERYALLEEWLENSYYNEMFEEWCKHKLEEEMKREGEHADQAIKDRLLTKGDQPVPDDKQE